MSQDFYAESDEAVAAGDHEKDIRTVHRTFTDDDADLAAVKRLISEESGLKTDDMKRQEEEEASTATQALADNTYSVDEDGTEWWQDDDAYWWFRPEGESDWLPYDE